MRAFMVGSRVVAAHENMTCTGHPSPGEVSMSNSESGLPDADARGWATPEGPAAPTLATVFAAADLPVTRKLGWTPPPKRGLVPIRPIPFGVILGAPFRLQRRAPRTTLAPALVISLVTTTLAMLLSWGLIAGPEAALDAAYYGDYLYASALLGVLSATQVFIPLMLAFPATALLAGAVVVATSRAVLAERVSYRGLRWRLTGRTPRLVAWTTIVFLTAVTILVLVTALPLSVATGVPGAGSLYAGLIQFVEGLVLLLLVGPLTARLGFVSHVLAIEGLSLVPAVRRSWSLSRRSTWRLYGSQLGVWALVAVASAVLLAPLGFVLDFGVGLLFPNGATAAQSELYEAGRTIVLAVATAVMGAFGLVLQTATGALLYLDARMRTEGFDLTLARYVDERQRGVAVADPFPSGGAAAPVTGSTT
jgi:hypothetical protein